MGSARVIFALTTIRRSQTCLSREVSDSSRENTKRLPRDVLRTPLLSDISKRKCD